MNKDQSATIDFEIPNWQKYNPRTDRKVRSWLRLEHTIFTDQTLLTLDAMTKLVFVFFLCEAAKKNGNASVNVNYALMVLGGLSEKQIFKSAKQLNTHGVIKVLGDTKRHQVTPTDTKRNQTDRYGALRTNVRTNETNEPIGADAPHPSGDGVTRLAKIWNENCGTLAKVKICKSERKRKSKARWAETPGMQSSFDDSDPADYWIEIVKRIVASDFCNGRTPAGTWQADFDFLLKPNTHVKVSEGKYDNREKTLRDHTGNQATLAILKANKANAHRT